MKLAAVPENLIERIMIRLGLVPRPLVDTQVAYTLARTIMAAVQLDLFEALSAGPLTAEAVSERCHTHPRATRALLKTLTGVGYLRSDGERYELAAVARKWLLGSSPTSLRGKLLLQVREWEWVTRYDEFVRTGKPLNIHGTLSSQDWGLYQRGMRSLAGVSAAEVSRRTPVPRGARDLLDIGGSHGYYSVALCRRHSKLRAVILDLPNAVAHAEKILATEGMGDRVSHRAGDARTEDLGREAWDVVLVAQLLHHFDEETNRELARRVARALRPGGVFVVQEMIRPASPRELGQVGVLLDLYFAATSASGTWALDDIASWQRDAGLSVRKPRCLYSLPGCAQQVGVKPLSSGCR
jgi:SAM-dependent methyltransferase